MAVTYFKIDGADFSAYVNELKVSKSSNYTAQTNAAGDTVVDYINQKRTIEVGIIPLAGAQMAQIQAAIEPFNVVISYLDPKTQALVEDVNCIVPINEVDYYTIQTGKVMLNGCNLKFIEL